MSNLRQVLRLHLFGRPQQVLECFAQHGGVHQPPASVVAFGKLSQRVGGGKGERHAGRRAAELAEGLASCLAEQSAQQFAAELFKILGGEAYAGSGNEFLDVSLVEFDAMRLADAVHHFDLQRNDGHGSPRLRQ